MSTGPVARFNVVYHVTTIHHWESILTEQLAALLRNRQTKALHVTLAAPDATRADAAVRSIDARVGGAFAWRHEVVRLEEYEHPAMRLVERLAREDDAPVLYFHMKGVSAWPPAPVRETWRRYMQRLIEEADRWAEFLREGAYDACGPLRLFDPSHGYTYFAGNFWMASATYLRGLRPYDEFLEKHGIAGFKAGDRMLAELAVNRERRMRSHAIDGRDFVPETIGPFLWSQVPPAMEPGNAWAYGGVGLRKP